MILKSKIASLVVFFLIGLVSSFLQAVPLTDEEIVKSFTVKNKKVLQKSGKTLTFSIYPSEPISSTLPKVKSDITLATSFFEYLQAVGLKPKWNQDIPYRFLTLYINLPDEEANGISHVGYISLREIFTGDKSNNRLSSFLILNHLQILEPWQRKGIGLAALSSFLEILDALNPTQISHDLYAILGNSNPGVYKMYLDKGFNTFVNSKTQKFFDINKSYDPTLLTHLKEKSSSYFSTTDVPTSCLIRRERGGKRLYDPYFF